MTGKRWVGAGPYRIWNNRQGGTKSGASNPVLALDARRKLRVPGIRRILRRWRWLELRTRAGRVRIRNESNMPFYGFYRPQPGNKPVIELPELERAFLHAIPAIGTKFDRPELLGPQSRPTHLPAVIEG